METGRPAGPVGTGTQEKLFPGSSRAEIPRAGPGECPGERSGVRVLCPLRGVLPRELCHVAKLSLIPFLLHPLRVMICSSNPKGITTVSWPFLGTSRA